MYNVNDMVEVYNISSLKIEKGEILTKFKVIDDRNNRFINENVYLISFSPVLDSKLVAESDIIGVVKYDKRK